MKKILPSILALAVALAVITALIVFTSDSPAAPLAAFFLKPFSSWWYAGNMLNMAGLMILAAAGSAFALRSGNFNLGGEAQIYAPGLIAAVILSAGQSGAPVSASHPAAAAAHFALALGSAAATGAVLGFIPGILKARWRVSELLTSFLLSAALVPVVDFLVSGPLRDQSKNLLATPAIAEGYRLPPFAGPSFFNASFFIAVGLAVLAGLFLKNTRTGFHIRVAGTAPEFARFAGFPTKSASVAGMTVSGAFHGLAGFFAISGTWYMCHQGFSAGMGWSALAIALIARANLFAVIPAALLYSWLATASDAAVLSTRFSFDSTSIVQAVIFLIITARVFPLIRDWSKR